MTYDGFLYGLHSRYDLISNLHIRFYALKNSTLELEQSYHYHFRYVPH